MRSPRTWPVHGHANMFLFCAPMAFQTPLSFEIPCCETPLSFKTSVLTQITPQRSPRHLRLSKSRVNAQKAFGQCFAGTVSPQKNGALESGSVSLEPDPRKKLGRWNQALFRWNLIPAKN